MKKPKARFIRRISAVSNAIETIDNEMICLIIFCLNCIRHGRNATYEPGLSRVLHYDKTLRSFENTREIHRVLSECNTRLMIKKTKSEKKNTAQTFLSTEIIFSYPEL